MPSEIIEPALISPCRHMPHDVADVAYNSWSSKDTQQCANLPVVHTLAELRPRAAGLLLHHIYIPTMLEMKIPLPLSNAHTTSMTVSTRSKSSASAQTRKRTAAESASRLATIAVRPSSLHVLHV